MQIYANKLASHLKQTLSPVYVIAGDDILLKNEASDAVRDAAKKQGFIERECFVNDSSFDWSSWLDSCNAMSLFASQRIIELHLPSSKIGTVGSDAVHRYCENPAPDTILLIIAARIEGNPKWVKTATNAGVYVPIYPLDHEQLPNWLSRRAKTLNLSLAHDAAVLLAERVEGNSLAAAQELEKLALLLPEKSTISRDIIGRAVADSARFSAFDAFDHAVDGDALSASRALRHLQEEGTEPVSIIAPLAHLLRNLCQLKAFESRRQLDQGFKALRIQRRRQNATAACLSKLSAAQLNDFVKLSAQADTCSKSVDKDNAWLLIEMVLMGLAASPLPTTRFHLQS